MPNGSTHDLITILTAPVIAVATYYFTRDIKTTTIVIVAFLFASFMFNGDLDTNSSPYNRWWILKMFWIPYQLMFDHRSIFTHGIIIGTVIRLLYVGIVPVIYLWSTNKQYILNNVDPMQALFVFIGLELGSAIHSIADWTL